MAKPAKKESKKASPIPKQPSTGPPPPFELPSKQLATHFLPALPTDHIYIIHTDATPPLLKHQVFSVPLAINAVITLALLARLYYAVPTYSNLVTGALGYASPTTIDVKSSTRVQLLSITLWRTLILLGDYLLFSLLGAWPWRFVFGLSDTRYSSPLKWRRAVRFADKEIIVRRSRAWDRGLLPNWTVDDELTLKHKIMPALEGGWLSRTGYLLEDQNWSLDFRAMVEAHSLIGREVLEFGDFEKCVLVHYPPSAPSSTSSPESTAAAGWMIWHVSKADHLQTAQQRQSLLRFQEKLSAMGHEDLFFRWVELVQYESNSPGGFTPGRQASAMREAKRIFEERGIDFARFWMEVGGMEGMPGLESSVEASG